MHVFIDAMAQVHQVRPEARAVIVGGPHETEPRYADELRARVLALGLDGVLSFAGFRSNAAEWMQAMDVFVHASDREPFGIVVIEAMALGKPVIAGDCGRTGRDHLRRKRRTARPVRRCRVARARDPAVS